jgi:hypothetical protein
MYFLKQAVKIFIYFAFSVPLKYMNALKKYQRVKNLAISTNLENLPG